MVELEQDGRRIVLDVGLPLEQIPFRDLLPDVDGLWSHGDGSLEGVFITHGHPDHFGLADLVDPSVPIYMGKGAKSVIDESAFFTGREPGFGCAGFLKDESAISAGPFTVTPHLVDHSGFDAHGLLVEAGGHSLLYTGDIRFHGRKSDRMNRLPGKLPENLDCLLMEGTNFDRARPEGPASEQELEAHLASSFQSVKGSAVCFFSAQNTDRLVTIFRSAKKSGRTFVYDLYGATIAAATERSSIPQPTWDEVRILVRERERRQVLRTEEFFRVKGLADHRIYRDEIAKDPSRFVLTGRASSVEELAESGCLRGARAYWSMWGGYLDRDSMLTEALARNSVDVETAHVSGHATSEDLVDFARRVDPNKVVSIHARSPLFLNSRVPSFQPTSDREWWSVSSAQRQASRHQEA